MSFLRINLWDDETLIVLPWAFGTSKRLVRVVAHERRTSGVDKDLNFYSTYKMKPRRAFINWRGTELGVIEDAIKLDVLPKKHYADIRAEYEKKRQEEELEYCSQSVLHLIDKTTIKLSPTQIAKLKKAAGI